MSNDVELTRQRGRKHRVERSADAEQCRAGE
jgi:hypothetical protein